MRDHAVFFSPLWLTASAFVKVAGFWLHDTHIATGQLAHTYKAMSLGIAFFGFLSAAATKNITGVGQRQWSADKRVKRK